MPRDAALPASLRTTIDAEMQAGERPVWIGQPIAGRVARGTWPIVAFGVPFAAFALFWIAVARSMTGSMGDPFPIFSLFFPLFGVPFLLIGLGMVSMPYWAWRSARRSAYVITDRRVLILTSSRRGALSVESIEPARLQNIERTQYPDGSGDLVFAAVDLSRRGRRRKHEIGFDAVRDVRKAEEAIRALAARGR